jgi:hypothetical protein
MEEIRAKPSALQVQKKGELKYWVDILHISDVPAAHFSRWPAGDSDSMSVGNSVCAATHVRC